MVIVVEIQSFAGSTSMSEAENKVSLTIRNEIADLEKVVHLVDDFGHSSNLSQKITDDLNLCLDELLNNVINHGFDDAGPHAILISLWLDTNSVMVEVRDNGKPFDPRRSGQMRVEGDLQARSLGGVGLVFVNSLMDKVDYARGGQYNYVTLKKKI